MIPLMVLVLYHPVPLVKVQARFRGAKGANQMFNTKSLVDQGSNSPLKIQEMNFFRL